MGELLKKISELFSKWVSISLIVFSVVLVILFRGWIFEQFNHVLAYYYVDQGDKEYFNSNLQGAISNYNYALKLYPEHVRARYNLGNIYSSYEDFYTAIDCYEKALSYDPDYLNSRMNLGVLLSEEIHDYDRAIKEFDKATKSNQLIMMIPFLFDNGYYVKSNIAAAYYNLGLAYKYKSLLFGTNKILMTDYLREAVKNYKKSVEIDPKVYVAHYNYALSLHLLGIHDEALIEYCNAINLEPLNYEAHYNLAILLHDKKQYRDARDELEKTGLILDSNGETDKLRYIFGVMNEIGQKVVLSRDEYGNVIDKDGNVIDKDGNVYNKYGKIIDNINGSPAQSDDITYINGKVVATEEIEGAIVDNFRKCSYTKISDKEKK